MTKLYERIRNIYVAELSVCVSSISEIKSNWKIITNLGTEKVYYRRALNIYSAKSDYKSNIPKIVLNGWWRKNVNKLWSDN